MSTTIRLTRMGRKKRPFYRLVVLDSRKRRDGAYLANLGYYNPFHDPHEVELHHDEILSWLSKGATVSETARSLLRAEGILYKFSLVKEGVEASEIETRMADWRQRAESRRQAKVDAIAAKAAAAKEAEIQAREEAEATAKAEEEAAAKAAEEAAAAKAAEEAAAAKAAEEEAAAKVAEEEAAKAAEEEAAKAAGEEAKDEPAEEAAEAPKEDAEETKEEN